MLNPRNKEFWWALIPILFFVGMVSIGASLVESGDLSERMSKAGVLAPALFVLLKMSTIIITPLGGSPIYLTAETLFGFKMGYILVVLGDVLGYSFNFWIGRIFGLRILTRVLSESRLEWVIKIVGKISDWRKLIVTVVALAPIADVVSYVIGISRIRYSVYFFALLVCALVHAFLMMSFGALIVSDAKTYILAVCIILIISSLLVKATRRWREDITK